MIQPGLQISLKKKIAKRSESEIFFGKNCEAKRSENKKNFCEAKRSEAKRSEEFFHFAKNCEIAKIFSKLRKKCEELLYRL